LQLYHAQLTLAIIAKHNVYIYYVVHCDQRHKRETQINHKDRREDQVPTERRRPRQA